jgi:hypothetical protein
LIELGATWDEWYGRLVAFYRAHLHSRVLAGYKTEEGYRLGGWVSVQRKHKYDLDPERQRRLEELPGWSWDIHLEWWEDAFSHLQEFSTREGHCRVPTKYETEEGYRLGSWVAAQRIRKADMDLERRQRLEKLPGWSWDAFGDQWEDGLLRLSEFSEREGHCRVPKRYKTEDGYPLGHWVVTQRVTKGDMNPERVRRLEELPSWSWDIKADKWEDGILCLREFSEREGHCRVPKRYKTEDGYPLGHWVVTQRVTKGDMDAERLRRLEELPGWSWDALSDK